MQNSIWYQIASARKMFFLQSSTKQSRDMIMMVMIICVIKYIVPRKINGQPHEGWLHIGAHPALVVTTSRQQIIYSDVIFYDCWKNIIIQLWLWTVGPSFRVVIEPARTRSLWAPTTSHDHSSFPHLAFHVHIHLKNWFFFWPKIIGCIKL